MNAAGPARILITGAGGFAGRHLLPALRQAFPSATLLAGSRQRAVAGTDMTLLLDLDKPSGLAGAIAAARPDAVIHLAAQADVGASFGDPQGTWRTNLLGTVALGEAVLQAAPDAAFILASSGEVYGLSFQTGHSLEEAAALSPANPYAASKAAADIAVGEMALRGLRALRLRTFTHSGAGQTSAFVVAAFARQIARIEAGLQEPVVHTGALDRWRDFLDVRDVCAAYVATLRTPLAAPAGLAMNICSGRAQRVGDVLADLMRLSGVTARIEEQQTLLRPTDVMRVQGDASRARQCLGWTPTIAWDETLRWVLADWRARVQFED